MIREYDIKAAGPTILLNKNYFTKEEYDKLLSMDNLTRNILVGNWLRINKDVNKVMMDEFIEIRKMFFDKNELEDYDIISIKKDAIFVIDKDLNNLEFGVYKFVKKNEYTDYLYVDGKEFYYNKYTNKLDVKGCSKESKEIQMKLYFSLIIELFKMKNKNDIFKKLIEFKDDYLNYNLPKDFYRTIETNQFPFKLAGGLVYMEEIPDVILNKVNINSNLIFINMIISIFL